VTCGHVSADHRESPSVREYLGWGTFAHEALILDLLRVVPHGRIGGHAHDVSPIK
jgi:hypothetical protein